MSAKATPRPKVDFDATVERLHRVGLVRTAHTLGERLAEATKEELAPHGFLDRLLDDELREREERRVRASEASNDAIRRLRPTVKSYPPYP